MIVMKFGGTSVADAAALTTVADIVSRAQALGKSPVVILSATSGTTNDLIRLAHLAADGPVDTDESFDADALAAQIVERHHEICQQLLPENVQQLAFQDIQEIGDQLTRYVRGVKSLGECTNRSLDTMASFGEQFSTVILMHVLITSGKHATLVDARSLIRTDDSYGAAHVNFEQTVGLCERNLIPRITPTSIVVTQGFIGATGDGVTTTLGRGGSDYTAAIIGASIHAEEIQIWTDVSGVYSADPRIVSDAQPIPSLSYNEVRELALYGAKVLHPATIEPAIRAGVTVRVLNTFQSSAVGTAITAENLPHAEIHAVSIVKDCVQIRGDFAAVTACLTSEHVRMNVILESRSLEHISVIVRTPAESDRTNVEVAAAGHHISIERCSVIIATGPGATQPSSIARLLSTLAEHKLYSVVNGMNDVSVFFVCAPEDAAAVLQKLHSQR